MHSKSSNTSSVSIVETLHFIEKSYNIQYIIMYSKDELSAKSVVQLKDLAKEIGVKIKSGDNKETIIYTILDALAEASADGAAQKRKRTRIASKKEDRVYSVHGIEGENFDVMKTRLTALPLLIQPLKETLHKLSLLPLTHWQLSLSTEAQEQGRTGSHCGC